LESGVTHRSDGLFVSGRSGGGKGENGGGGCNGNCGCNGKHGPFDDEHQIGHAGCNCNGNCNRGNVSITGHNNPQSVIDPNASLSEIDRKPNYYANNLNAD